jgi:hypothetical protein
MLGMTLLSWKGALLGETPRPTGRVTRPVALSATRDSFKPALLTRDVSSAKSKIQNFTVGDSVQNPKSI